MSPTWAGTSLLSFSRRRFIKSLSRSALVLSLDSVLSLALPLRMRGFAQNSKSNDLPKLENPPESPKNLDVNFINVARESGLNVKTIFGGEHKNKYLLETTGCGVAFYDYDNDGWLDIFLVNGSRLEGFPAGQEPISHLFKNNRDGTFLDVTAKAGLRHSGWTELAVRALQRALAMDPNNPVAHHLLGQAYRELGRNEDAERELKAGGQLQQRQDEK